MHYSVCLDTVCRGMSAAEALGCIRSAGLDHYEFWGWWDRGIDALLAAQQATGLKPVAMCTRMVPLNDPARRGEYLDGLRETAAVCRKLGCTTVITQTGADLPDVPHAEQMQSIIDGLIACIPVLEEHGLTLVFEPLNPKDHPGYSLVFAEEAFFIAEAVNDPHVKVLYDIYHQHVTGDFHIDDMVSSLGLIGHIHIAGDPGRHEPLECGMDYPAIMAAIRHAGYQGAAGLEYLPVHDPAEGLRSWAAACGE